MFSSSVTREEKLRKEFRDYGKEMKDDLKEYIKESIDANTRYILSEMRSEIRSLEIRLGRKIE
ncbi:hypothetical protein BDZ91DRAFT_720526 [Kalaharituber pfeilii]|nr:hypothetical protein BDZ91DRAFT_720526 [Kalaharituber pfeilii]